MESFLENVKDLKLFMVNIAFIVSSILYGIQYLEEIKEGNRVSFKTEKGPKGLNAIEVKQAK